MRHATGDILSAAGTDPTLAGLYDEVIRRLQAGDPVDLTGLTREHPEHAAPLRRLLPAMQALVGLGGSPDGHSSRGAPAGGVPDLGPGVIGDYRILREIGRGGMGIVYEAEQLSLNRRVALKVLPMAAALDARQFQRFRLEAQAAACLHHNNIVPVFAVGTERGMPFYAMQYIEGRSLAEVLHELRGEERPAGEPPAQDGGAGRGPADLSTTALARSLLSGEAPMRQADAPIEPQGPLPSHRPPRDGQGDGPIVAVPKPSKGAPSTRTRDYSRNIARLGLQAADALDHAHARGILHRDIKPANLLLDAEGRLWVTDFGLAQIQGHHDGLTLSGDILGTLRYMSPEQASGKRVVVDGRTDIYSLGVTLYELLTMRPAHDGHDRAETLCGRAAREPTSLRRLNPAVPPDLATIVHKAMAAEPSERYATARELADDLQRFLGDRPIRARPPGLTARLAKWSGRNPAVAWSCGLLVALTLVASASANFLIAREQRRTAAKAEALRRQDYVHRVHRAYHDVSENQVGSADRMLDACPDDLRGWEWSFLRRLCHPDLRTTDEGSPVNAVAFSPDGRLLASGGGDPVDVASPGSGALVVRDAETGRPMFSRRGLEDSVLGLAFSPDGRLVATAGGRALPSREGEWAVWDLATGERSNRRSVVGLHARCVAFSQDGKHLAVGLAPHISIPVPGYVALCDPKTGEERSRIEGPPGGAYGVAFSPDGTLVALAGIGSVEIWDVGTGRRRHALGGFSNFAFTVAFSPDGKRVVAGGWDRSVRVWDADNGRELKAMAGHAGFLYAVAFSPDGRVIASASEDGNVKLWDARTYRELGTLRGHAGFVTSVAYHPDGRRLASGAIDRTVKLWGVATSRPVVLEMPDWVHDLAFLPDGSGLVTSAATAVRREAAVMLWDPATGELRSRYRATSAGAVTFTPGGETLRLIGLDETSRLVDDHGREISATIHLPGKPPPSPGALRVRPDRREAALGQPDGSVLLVDLGSGRPVRAFQAHSASVTAVAYAPDGRRLVTVGGDAASPRPRYEVKLWDLVGARELRTLRRGAGVLGLAAVSPDGRALALVRGSRTDFAEPEEIVLWDGQTGRELATLSGHGAAVWSLAFSPDGRRLATGSIDRTVKLWDTATGDEVLTLSGHAAGVISLAWSPDGRRLASGSIDLTARVWDASPPPSETPRDMTPAPVQKE